MMSPVARHLPYRAVTAGPLQHFFGYYDKTPWDGSGRYLLALETGVAGRSPGADDAASVCVVDLQDGNRVTHLATTLAWNWQQGAMLQWLPGLGERVLLFSDRRQDRFVSVVWDLGAGEVRTVPLAASAVSHDGTRALSLNFARLASTRPGYGYAGLQDPWADSGAPDQDGIRVVDLVTGESRLLVSLAEVASFRARDDMAGAVHWIDHVQFSPDDRRFAFLHRWSTRPADGWQTRLYTAALDGTDLQLLADHGLVSHFDWRDPGHVLAWARRRGSFGRMGMGEGLRWLRHGGVADAYSIFARGGRSRAVGPAVLKGDGHCTFSPDGEWLLTDTYPDRANLRTLILYHLQEGRRVDVAQLYSPPELGGELRCDLHPRWSRDGTQICFDSAHEGARQMYVMDVTAIVRPGTGRKVTGQAKPADTGGTEDGISAGARANLEHGIRHTALMIAYIFPPIGGSAVQRTLGFVKYLPSFGWRPVVVCGDQAGAYGIGFDPTHVDDIPPEAIVCRRPFISAYGPRRWLMRKLGLRAASGLPGLDEKPGDQSQIFDLRGAAPVASGPRKSPLRQALGVLAKPMELLEKPVIDSGFYWALSAVPFCLKAIREQAVDVIYTQSFPYSDHLPGIILHLLTKKPWVVDLHDPWTRNATFRHAGFRRKVDVFVERQILRHATKVIACTPPYTQDFRDLAPPRDPADFHTIAVGYDQADFDRLRDLDETLTLPWNASEEKVTIAHVGFVFPQSAIPFLSALEGLDEETASHLRIVFIGGLARPDMHFLREHPLPVEVVLSPRIHHAQATHAMKSADAVLLLVAHGPYWMGHIPGKVFEYMNCGTLIFYSGPVGATARVVEESRTGCIAPFDDAETTRALLRQLVRDRAAFREQFYAPRPEVIQAFERKGLTGKLAQVLEEARTGQGRTPRRALEDSGQEHASGLGGKKP